ncbi:MAG: sugar phosphate isomerase/epimerase [Planctomycetaceae bacterium]|nr:sugar phosphate isomerase/epimerase [Planctomycetales bacterium]MCB9938057.1 sugar phosphate isomerase/epimerase [Planctomycetaceae bacterium]
MHRSFDRRRFLQTCSVTSAAVASGLATGIAHAAEPIVRNGEPKFKFSLAAYSYRKLLQGKTAELTVADFIDDCAKMQLEGTELTSYYFPEPVTPEYLRQLKHQCFRLGLGVSGTAVGNDFGIPPGEKRDEQIAHLKHWIDNAEILGAPVIRVFAGKVAKDTTPEQSHKLMVEGLQECCDYAGQHGVHLALENHGGPTATAEGLLALVNDVQSPWFGVNLDTGNFHTEDPYGDLAKVAPFAVNVQVKVVIIGPDGKKEPADFKRIADILRDVNYRGYVVLEFEEDENPREACPSFVAQLREAFA